MTSFNPVIKNGASGAIFYVGLVSQADTRLLKSTPTLATGDFKVSIDGGALANLGTTPTNTPSAQMVKITLSQAEVNGDNITVVCSDVAGAEWCDLLINLQTVAAQFDDIYSRLGAPAGASVSADIAAVQAKTTNLPASPAAVGSAMTLTGAYDFGKGTAAMTESYAANGVAPTPVQALYAMHQMMMDFAISTTNYTVKKLDNSTTAFVVTLNDASAPTAAART